jgi:hypothetical protein
LDETQFRVRHEARRNSGRIVAHVEICRIHFRF